MKYAVIAIIVVLVGAIAFSLLPRVSPSVSQNATSTPTSTVSNSTSTNTTSTDTSKATSTQTQSSDLVVDMAKNPLIKSPLTITGKIRGTYMFEASFPIVVTDANGRQLGAINGTTKSDWMTSELVPFTATIEFSSSTTPTGYLVFKNDNPSGIPSRDKSIKIPVRFAAVQSSGGGGILPYDSGIKGTVLMSPTCGIQSAEPTNACQPAPYSTTVQVFRLNGSLFAEMQTNASGVYSIVLPPGDYIARPLGGNIYPRCENTSVSVKPGQFVLTNFSCDTGIR